MPHSAAVEDGMRARRTIRWVAAAAALALSALPLALLPAGAGQHFGVLAQEIFAIGSSATSTASSAGIVTSARPASARQAQVGAAVARGGNGSTQPDPITVRGMLAFGPSAEVTGSRPPMLATARGCIALSRTGMTDVGCLDEEDPAGMVVRLANDAVGRLTGVIVVTFRIPSQTMPGTFIEGELRFSQFGPPRLEPVIVHVRPDFYAEVSAGLVESAQVSGQITSSAIGSGSVALSVGVHGYQAGSFTLVTPDN